MKIRNFFRKHLVAQNGVRHGNAGHSNRFGTRLARFESLEQRTLLSVSPMDGWDTLVDWGVPINVPQNPDVSITDNLKALYGAYVTSPNDFIPDMIQDMPRVRVKDDRVAIAVYANSQAEAAEELQALGMEVYHEKNLESMSIITGYFPIERLVDVSAVDGAMVVIETVLSSGSSDSPRKLPDRRETPDFNSPEYLNSPEYILDESFSRELIQLYKDYLVSPESLASDHPEILFDDGRIGVLVSTHCFETEVRIEQLKSCGMEVVKIMNDRLVGWLPIASFFDVADFSDGVPLSIFASSSKYLTPPEPAAGDNGSESGQEQEAVPSSSGEENPPDVVQGPVENEPEENTGSEQIEDQSPAEPPSSEQTGNVGGAIQSPSEGWAPDDMIHYPIPGVGVLVIPENGGPLDLGGYSPLNPPGVIPFNEAAADTTNTDNPLDAMPSLESRITQPDGSVLVEELGEPDENGWYFAGYGPDDMQTYQTCNVNATPQAVVGETPLGGDTFECFAEEAFARHNGPLQFRADFEHVHGYAENGGNDTAHLYDDSSTVDTLWARDDQAKVENTSVGWSRIAEAFDAVYAHSSDGLDDNEDLPDPLSLLDFTLDLSDWDG